MYKCQSDHNKRPFGEQAVVGSCEQHLVVGEAGYPCKLCEAFRGWEEEVNSELVQFQSSSTIYLIGS